MTKQSMRERRRIGRWMMGMLIGTIAFAFSVSNSFATTIEACQNRHGKITIIQPEGSKGPDSCGLNGTLLTWNVAGPQGLTGPQGPIGPAGVAGPTGVAGSAGPAGPLGPVGSAGATGPTAIAAPPDQQDQLAIPDAAGPAGPTGPAGADGATGATGAPGSSLALLFGGTQTNAIDIIDPTYMGPGNGFLVTATQNTGTQTVGVPMPTVGICTTSRYTYRSAPWTSPIAGHSISA